MAKKEVHVEGPPVGELPIARKRPVRKVSERVAQFKDEHRPKEGVQKLNPGFFQQERRREQVQVKRSDKLRVKLRGAR